MNELYRKRYIWKMEVITKYYYRFYRSRRMLMRIFFPILMTQSPFIFLCLPSAIWNAIQTNAIKSYPQIVIMCPLLVVVRGIHSISFYIISNDEWNKKQPKRHPHSNFHHSKIVWSCNKKRESPATVINSKNLHFSSPR